MKKKTKNPIIKIINRSKFEEKRNNKKKTFFFMGLLFSSRDLRKKMPIRKKCTKKSKNHQKSAYV